MAERIKSITNSSNQDFLRGTPYEKKPMKETYVITKKDERIAAAPKDDYVEIREVERGRIKIRYAKRATEVAVPYTVKPTVKEKVIERVKKIPEKVKEVPEKIVEAPGRVKRLITRVKEKIIGAPEIVEERIARPTRERIITEWKEAKRKIEPKVKVEAKARKVIIEDPTVGTPFEKKPPWETYIDRERPPGEKRYLEAIITEQKVIASQFEEKGYTELAARGVISGVMEMTEAGVTFLYDPQKAAKKFVPAVVEVAKKIPPVTITVAKKIPSAVVTVAKEPKIVMEKGKAVIRTISEMPRARRGEIIFGVGEFVGEVVVSYLALGGAGKVIRKVKRIPNLALGGAGKVIRKVIKRIPKIRISRKGMVGGRPARLHRKIVSKTKERQINRAAKQHQKNMDKILLSEVKKAKTHSSELSPRLQKLAGRYAAPPKQLARKEAIRKSLLQDERSLTKFLKAEATQIARERKIKELRKISKADWVAKKKTEKEIGEFIIKPAKIKKTPWPKEIPIETKRGVTLRAKTMEEIIIQPTVRKPLIKKRTIQSQRKQIIKSRKQTATTIQREAKTYDKRMYDAFDTEPAAAIPMKEFPVFMQKELTRIEKLRQEQLLKAFPTPKIAEPLIKPVAITKLAKKEKMKEMFRIDELAIQKEELRLGTSVALASMMKTEQKQFQEHMKIFGIAEIQKPISIFKPEYIQKMAQAQEQIFKTPIPTKIKPFIFAPIKIKRKEIVPKEKKIISPISKEIRTIFKPPRIKEVKPIPIDRILPRALTFPDAGPPRDMFKLFRPGIEPKGFEVEFKIDEKWIKSIYPPWAKEKEAKSFAAIVSLRRKKITGFKIKGIRIGTERLRKRLPEFQELKTAFRQSGSVFLEKKRKAKRKRL